MAVRTVMLTDEELNAQGINLVADHRIIQPESKVAHKWLDGLKGIEIGAAADQPFGLDAINVATSDPADREMYKGIQLVVCGGYVEVDVHAEADALPFEDNSQDFVVASHVVEHLSNPITALKEWFRVVRDGGYILMIVPKRSAPYGDEQRLYSTLEYFIKACDEHWTNEQAMELTQDKSATPRLRGHVWVFNLLSLIALVEFTCQSCFMDWQLIEAHETDDKDGLGHLAIWQVHKKENEDGRADS